MSTLIICSNVRLKIVINEIPLGIVNKQNKMNHQTTKNED